jgi:hypothetical protein
LPNPLRSFAREAVVLVLNPWQAVLRRRIAEHLANLHRDRIGLPACALEQLAPGERERCLRDAADFVAIAESIHTTAPPTDRELALVAAARPADLARASVRCEATRNGHQLRGFRPATEEAFEENACATCGAGARIHVATGDVSWSDALRQPCGGTR